MHRLSASSLLVCASLCLCAGASFADAAAQARAWPDAQGEGITDAIELDAASVSDLQRGLVAWLARTFDEAGLPVRVEPQGAWGFDGHAPSRVRAVLTRRERKGGAWQIDVSLARMGVEGKARGMARFRAVELASVWVASAALRKGEVIGCERLRRDTRPAAADKGHWQGACADLAHLTMRRSLMPGDVLRQEDMGAAFAVRHQSETTVLTRLGRIEVRATGVALADADIGAKVPVRLNGQTQVIHAWVIGPGTARLDEGL